MLQAVYFFSSDGAYREVLIVKVLNVGFTTLHTHQGDLGSYRNMLKCQLLASLPFIHINCTLRYRSLIVVGIDIVQ